MDRRLRGDRVVRRRHQGDPSVQPVADGVCRPPRRPRWPPRGGCRAAVARRYGPPCRPARRVGDEAELDPGERDEQQERQHAEVFERGHAPVACVPGRLPAGTRARRPGAGLSGSRAPDAAGPGSSAAPARGAAGRAPSGARGTARATVGPPHLATGGGGCPVLPRSPACGHAIRASPGRPGVRVPAPLTGARRRGGRARKTPAGRGAHRGGLSSTVCRVAVDREGKVDDAREEDRDVEGDGSVDRAVAGW